MVKKSLISKDLYDVADDILLDELVYNIKILDDTKADIKDRGLHVNVVKDPSKPPYYQQNPSVNTYLSTVKNVANLLTKLAITPQERAKLEVSDYKGDPLDQLLQKKKVVPA